MSKRLIIFDESAIPYENKREAFNLIHTCYPFRDVVITYEGAKLKNGKITECFDADDWENMECIKVEGIVQGTKVTWFMRVFKDSTHLVLIY